MLILNKVKYLNNNFSVSFSLQIKRGERLIISGPSGSGKSTFLKLIAGFLPASSGSIKYYNHDFFKIHPFKRPISILFQKNNLFHHLNVFQNIALGLNPGLKINKNEKKIIQYIAHRTKLTAYLKIFPECLSEGQKQLVALARCLIRNKPILLLDEPLSFLDPDLCLHIIYLILEICKKKNYIINDYA